MAQFMVQITLPEFKDEYFISLIPDQREYVDSLMGQGVISNYCLSLDMVQLWVTFNMENEAGVVKELNNFPLSEFIQYEIIELTFNNTAPILFPTLSLN